jgi:catechol 2,3-dioxygenase-like lactoylglutathione lyase family enzyme
MLHADSPIVGIAQSAEYVLAGLYTGGATCFAASTGKFLWHQPEASGATKSVSVSRDFFAMTGRYDPLRVGSLVDGSVLARLALDTPVSDVVEFNPDVDRLAVCAAEFQVWIVAVVESGPDSGLQLTVLHQGEGHTAPVKAIAWIDPETVVSGCYNGHLYVHRIGRPSIRIAQVDSRLGISALAVNGNRIYWATFDGCVGYCQREVFADI